jgi:NTE family protein
MAQLYTPYAFGDSWQNPLEPVVRDLDFSEISANVEPKLFVSATNVRTGKIKVFQGAELTPEALLASACIPTVFQTVEIDGEAYWDGGYTGNPALFPLYEPDLPDDILVVSINPLRRDEVPQSPEDIQNRINEISFNASLLGELRAINFVRRLITDGMVEPGRMKAVNVHMISDDGLMNALSADSKLSPTPLLLERLKEAGRAAAERFLQDGGTKIGQQPTVDLVQMLG